MLSGESRSPAWKWRSSMLIVVVSSRAARGRSGNQLADARGGLPVDVLEPVAGLILPHVVLFFVRRKEAPLAFEGRTRSKGDVRLARQRRRANAQHPKLVGAGARPREAEDVFHVEPTAHVRDAAYGKVERHINRSGARRCAFFADAKRAIATGVKAPGDAEVKPKEIQGPRVAEIEALACVAHAGLQRRFARFPDRLEAGQTQGLQASEDDKSQQRDEGQSSEKEREYVLGCIAEAEQVKRGDAEQRSGKGQRVPTVQKASEGAFAGALQRDADATKAPAVDGGVGRKARWIAAVGAHETFRAARKRLCRDPGAGPAASLKRRSGPYFFDNPLQQFMRRLRGVFQLKAVRKRRARPALWPDRWCSSPCRESEPGLAPGAKA